MYDADRADMIEKVTDVEPEHWVNSTGTIGTQHTWC